MKKASRVGLRLSFVGLAVLALSAVPMSAQVDSTTSSSSSTKHLTSSSVHESRSAELPRVWAAISGSYLPFKAITTKSTSNSTTGEQVTSTSANGQAGAGVTVNARLFRGYWISLGAIYRFTGYDTTDAVNSNTFYLERTRARFIDFPALIRYAGPHFRWSKYSFYELGGAVRYATHIQLTQAATDASGNYYCCAPASTTGIKRMTEGVVVGTGMSGRDDFGIIVSPEVRYTRWMGNTFSSPTVGTMRNQLEVTVSFGF
jgi:hypothetical protein